MAKRNEVFPNLNLSAADLNGKPITLTIESAPQMTLRGKNGSGEEVKTVLYFHKTKKRLPLNRTNWDSVADITGEDDTVNWPGHRIEVYPTTTSLGAETVACVRIRAPAQGELKAAPAAKKAKAKTPEPEMALAAEMDDEIPFSLIIGFCVAAITLVTALPGIA
jgi:hypothetical protein